MLNFDHSNTYFHQLEVLAKAILKLTINLHSYTCVWAFGKQNFENPFFNLAT